MRFDGYVLNILHAGHHLRDRGVRPLGRARPVRPDQSGAGGVLRPRRLCGRAWARRIYHLSFWLCLVGGCVIALLAGAFLGHVHAAARRPLSCDGDDLVPADRHAGDDQRDLAHARPRRRPATSSRPTCSSRRKLSRLLRRACWRSSAISSGICRTPSSGAPCARCATTSSRPASTASMCSAPRSTPSRSARCSADSAGGLFAGGFAYVSPDQFSFAESIVFLTMSLLGGVASPIGSAIGTGSADPDPGMAALPQERAGALSRDLRPVRDPDHPLHAGRHLGLRSDAFRRAGAPRPRRAPAAAAAAVEAGDGRRRHGAGSHRPVEAFRRPEGRRRRRHRGEARRRACADRAERLRQDHDAERALRPLQGDRRQDRARRHRHHRHAAASAHGRRPRAHVPEHPPVPLDDGAGERRDRRRAARQHAWSGRATTR